MQCHKLVLHSPPTPASSVRIFLPESPTTVKAVSRMTINYPFLETLNFTPIPSRPLFSYYCDSSTPPLKTHGVVRGDQTSLPLSPSPSSLLFTDEKLPHYLLRSLPVLSCGLRGKFRLHQAPSCLESSNLQISWHVRYNVKLYKQPHSLYVSHEHSQCLSPLHRYNAFTFSTPKNHDC